jgi:hypothetical protein
MVFSSFFCHVGIGELTQPSVDVPGQAPYNEKFNHLGDLTECRSN